MSLLQTLLAFIVAISLLVLVHELGHYLVARWCGVKVLRFSLGMGKVLFSRKIGPDQTEWSISALPMGGYVKLLDARSEDMDALPPEERQREFTQQKVWRRMAIVAAGPLSNFILAAIFLAGLNMYGVPEPAAKLRAMPEQSVAYQAGLRGGDVIKSINGDPVQAWEDLRWKLLKAAVDDKTVRVDVEPRTDGLPQVSYDLSLASLTTDDLEKDFMGKLGLSPARPPARIGKVLPDGAAMKAGLREGDRLMSINGHPLADGVAFVEAVRNSPGRDLIVTVLRDDRIFDVTVIPDTVPENGQPIGKIKAEIPVMPEMVTIRDNPLMALYKGVKQTWNLSVITVQMIGKMITGEVSLKNVTGPITIADYAGQTARAGLVRYVQFIAFISISIGVMNLLPIPVLDGGLLLYYAVEILTGRTVSGRFGEIAQRVGIALLMTLFVLAVFNDVVRLLT